MKRESKRTSVGWRILPALGFCLCGLLLTSSNLPRPLASPLAATPAAESSTAGGEAPDLQRLIAAARRTLQADLRDWGRLSFVGRVLRLRLNDEGAVTWRQTYRFRVHPSPKGFEETLLAIDGRPPKRSEVAEHARAGRFAKHYEQALAAKLGNPFGDDLPLTPLLFDQEHRWAGREVVAGVTCHRIVFEARSEARGASTAERLQRGTQGGFCLSVEGTHLVEAAVETARPTGSGLLRLKALRLRFEAGPAAGAWVPRLFEVRSDFKIGFDHLRKHNRYEYSAYRRPAVP